MKSKAVHSGSHLKVWSLCWEVFFLSWHWHSGDSWTQTHYTSVLVWDPPQWSHHSSTYRLSKSWMWIENEIIKNMLLTLLIIYFLQITFLYLLSTSLLLSALSRGCQKYIHSFSSWVEGFTHWEFLHVLGLEKSIISSSFSLWNMDC